MGSAQVGNCRRNREKCGADLLPTGKDWVLKPILLAVEERGLERQEGKRRTGRDREMFQYHVYYGVVVFMASW